MGSVAYTSTPALSERIRSHLILSLAPPGQGPRALSFSSLNIARARRDCKYSTCWAFTLIEVLVVVAIIALLLTILLPSLKQAREQAKIATCKANCKQIGTITAEYRAEHDDYLPVLFNYHHALYAPARCSYLSIAFRSYNKATARMSRIEANTGGTFDPNEDWTNMGGDEKYEEYEERLLPDNYVCPFERGKGAGSVSDVREGAKYLFKEYTGRIEYYHTWMWDGTVKGLTHGDRTVAHTSFTWNKLILKNRPEFPPPRSGVIPSKSGAVLYTGEHSMEVASNAHCKWDIKEVRRMRVASPSDATVVWCAKGEWTGWTDKAIGKPKWYNHNSHRTTRGGGTNVIFADSHVEWVIGTGIGWP
ncbi:MAG: type II secretion system protein [Planctomycetota bacterium]|jgi:prepilin-type N-terminal cleavage/methylation domain-containing protein/prepilin-type processing-associated H-X9-DG protein